MFRVYWYMFLTAIVCTHAYPAAWGGETIPDTVFLQEAGRQLPTESAVRAIGADHQFVFAGFDDGLRRLQDNALVRVEEVPAAPVHRLRLVGDALWCLTRDAAYVCREGEWAHVAGGAYVDVCALNERTVLASERMLYAVASDGPERLHETPSPLPITAVASYAGTLYCLAPDRLFLFDGREFVVDGKVIEFGALPSKDARDLLALPGRLLVATHYGLGEVRGTAATQILGADGLPWEECHHLARGFADDYWIGATEGVIRALGGGQFHYFTAPRWLPGNRVNGVAAVAGAVYVATDKGIGVIAYEPYTLRKKAAYYEQHLELWRQKRMAFTHKLEWNPGQGGWVREVSDNDVGWSTHYWAAMAFKYAVTGKEDARQAAVNGFNAMKWSEEIVPIDGFPARAIWAVGETGNKAAGGSGGYPAEWHAAEDDRWEWKGDTSSDETDAQFYYATVFHHLAADETLKAKVREHVARVAGHIVDNGWVLRDYDGLPTVWGRWDLEYFNSVQGRAARGLNGLEALTYMRTAQALTGEPRFQEAHDWLVGQNYHAWSINQKLVQLPMLVNHSDDRLAFYCYYAVLAHEQDPYLRGIHLRGLQRSWAIERIEHNPWFNFIYGAMTGAPCEAAQAVDHLRAWPLDLVEHPYDFTHRRDLDPPPGYVPYAHGEKPFSPRERGGYRWSSDPFQLRGGSGREVLDPSGWLDAYWMGRYYGMIAAPETDDPALLTVPPAPANAQPGAAPYDGPPMPDVLGR